jgi:hypothetical protein
MCVYNKPQSNSWNLLRKRKVQNIEPKYRINKIIFCFHIKKFNIKTLFKIMNQPGPIGN